MKSLSRSSWRSTAIGLGACASLLLVPGAQAKKKQAAARGKEQQASEQTQRAVSELAGKFKWGMTPDEVSKIVTDDISARYDAKVKKETQPARQDAVRSEMADQMKRFKDSWTEFKGQKTGWDVSIIDREFAHKNNEAMFVMWEKDQRRFLFFYNGYLWKQFIAFNAENPAFAGKTFDDFADVIQKRYGPASMTFKKLKTSDDQALDHLEWPPAGDYVLWAIDLTTFYGNFCLSLWQKSKFPDIDAGRKVNSPERPISRANADEVLKPSEAKDDANADIIDQITGRDPSADAEDKSSAKKAGASHKSAAKGKPKVHPRDEDKDKKETAADPLEGSGL